MSSVKSRFSVVVATSALFLGACATTQSDVEKPVDLANREQRAAAERADPLARARFWAAEYQKDPEDVTTATYFAKALREIESHERVIQVVSDTLILHPADYELLMLMGRTHLSMNNMSAATQAFGRAIQSDGTRADAFAALGLAYDRAEQHANAQRAYKKALAIDPNRTGTLANYGLSQALSGDIIGAEAALRKAASQPDADSRVRQNLALVLGLQGKFDEMKTVDEGAPESVMNQNADVLKSMIVRGERLSKIDQPISAPEPKIVEPADPAPITPVASAGLEDLGAAPAPAPETQTAQTAASVEEVLATAPTSEQKPAATSKTADLPGGLRGSLQD